MSQVKIGESFANYKILKPLGKGGMGEVFLAEDSLLDRKVAIKVLRIDPSQGQDVSVKRFQNEAKLLASLNHPNIVSIHNFGLLGNLNYIVMEYVEGVTLANAIKKKMIGVGESLQIVRHMVEGIGEAHSKGILHRDIKPSNIILDKNKNVKIVDFGISKNLRGDENNFTRTDHFIGTVNYTAPEILLGLKHAAAADIFSIGVVFYEMLVGENPFSTTNQFESIEKIKNHSLKLPDDLCALLPPRFIEVFNKMVSRERESRYQSTNDLLRDLAGIDPREVPDILFESLSHEVEIINKASMKEALLKKGFQSSEVEIILTLAANAESARTINGGNSFPQAEEHTDLTEVIGVPIGEGAVISNSGENLQFINVNISDDCLDLAIQRYTQTKTLHIKKNLTRGHQIPHSQQTSNSRVHYGGRQRGSSFLQFALVFVLLVGSGLLFSMSQYPVLSKHVYSKYIRPLGHLDLTKLLSAFKVYGNRKPAAIKKVNLSEPSLGVPAVGSVLQYKINIYSENDGKVIGKELRRIHYTHVNNMGAMVEFSDQVSKLTGRIHLSSNSFVPPIKYKNSEGKSEIVRLTGDYDELYPLVVGKGVEYSYTKIRGDGTFFQSKQMCKVIGEKAFLIQSKSVNTFVVECKEAPDVSTVTFYSPEIKSYVRREIRYQKNSKKLLKTSELVSIKIP